MKLNFQKLDIEIPVEIPVNFMILTGTGIPAKRLILTGTGILPGSRSILVCTSQVSEMHGELMELNQQLVAKNMIRERQLQDMEKKLAEIEAKVFLLL